MGNHRAVRAAAMSYGLFLADAYNALVQANTTRPDLNFDAVYDCYADFNPDGLAPKQVPAQNDVNETMDRFLGHIGNHPCDAQPGAFPFDNWLNLSGSIQSLREVYDGTNANPPAFLQEFAAHVSTTYVHVFPAVQRQVNNDWRIGLNVLPQYIDLAADKLLPILDQYNNIDEIKFLGAGSVDKPDSVIIYLERDQRHQNLVNDVLEAAVNMNQDAGQGTIHPVFSPMWEEIDLGIAECAEAPTNGVSFGTYRCLLTAISYWLMVRDLGTRSPGLNFFTFETNGLLGRYGVPANSPNLQQNAPYPGLNPALNTIFLSTRALSEGLNANAFAGRQLGI